MADNDLSVNYEAVLADLRAKRDKLDAAIAGIEIMLGMPNAGAAAADVPAASALPQVVESDTFFQMSVPDAARKFLGMRKRPQTTQEIAHALETGGVLHNSKDFPNTVGSILSRIDKTGGDIVKVGRAKFGLASWYSASKRRKVTGKAADNGFTDSAEPVELDTDPNEPDPFV